MTRRTTRRAWLSLAALVAGCALTPATSPFTASIGANLQPRLSADDAARITREYLDVQTTQIAAPELHVPTWITDAQAVKASVAATLDGCIPPQTSDDIVWVTKGTGDYLNNEDHPWSARSGRVVTNDPAAWVCAGPGPAGTIVIDDATGEILGVYPTNKGYPHPSAAR